MEKRRQLKIIRIVLSENRDGQGLFHQIPDQTKSEGNHLRYGTPCDRRSCL